MEPTPDSDLSAALGQLFETLKRRRRSIYPTSFPVPQSFHKSEALFLGLLLFHPFLYYFQTKLFSGIYC